jgi:phage repressor protein C with HTH and peptisase S24 domain
MLTPTYSPRDAVQLMASQYGEALAERRELVGYPRQTDLVAALDKLLVNTQHEKFSQQWLSRLERDRTGEIIGSARGPKLRALAFVLHWTLAELQFSTGVELGAEPWTPAGQPWTLAGNGAGVHGNVQRVELELVTVMAMAAAGRGVYTDEDAVGQILVVRDIARYPNRHTFMVEGNSMSPELEHGDAVHVDLSDTDLRDNRVYVVQLEVDGIVVKRARNYGPGQWWLISDNPAAPPLAKDDARVIGRVFAHSPATRRI